MEWEEGEKVRRKQKQDLLNDANLKKMKLVVYEYSSYDSKYIDPLIIEIEKYNAGSILSKYYKYYKEIRVRRFLGQDML